VAHPSQNAGITLDELAIRGSIGPRRGALATNLVGAFTHPYVARDVSQALRAEITLRTPPRALRDPDAVANAAGRSSSAEAARAAGQRLAVDGGRGAM
jgi:hypothetical protein